VSTCSMVSLGLVGEFPEVRTQVDRDLTVVSRVDRRLGLIKNLGRHDLEFLLQDRRVALPPPSPSSLARAYPVSCRDAAKGKALTAETARQTPLPPPHPARGRYG
jgi:hypothetical protein